MQKKSELSLINEKLNKILKNQKTLKSEEKEELTEEKTVEKEESAITSEEGKLLKKESALEKSLRRKTLKKLTLHDLDKGIIGAFMGTIGHFAFFEGKHISEQMSFGRATSLYIFAYLVGILFMYFSGFRKVKEERLIHLIPARVTLMFVISIISSIIILFMFNQISFASSAMGVYKMVANVSVLAMFGAMTADFLGD